MRLATHKTMAMEPDIDASSLLSQQTIAVDFESAIPRKTSLGIELDNLVTSAIALFRNDYPATPFIAERGMLRQIEELLANETNSLRKRTLLALLNKFRAYFNLCDTDRPDENDGKIRIFTSKNRLQALLTVTSPRGIGNMPTLNVIMAMLEKARITYGLNQNAIEKALAEIRARKDLIWCMPIAVGNPPKAGTIGRLKYSTNVIDKQRMAQNVVETASWLLPLWPPTEQGSEIGSITFSCRPQVGKSVFGESIFPPENEFDADIGADITIERSGALRTTAQGYVVADQNRIDLMPVYVMKDPSPQSISEFSFPGVVLVEGNLYGPGSIECDDLIVLGNVEQVNVACRGDIFVAGGVIGHHQTTLDADGRIVAGFISEAKLSALREIIAANAIINSHIISNTSIRVLSDKGMIAGGKLYSLKEIVSATIGSEFGMLTETTVGKDFLGSSRMENIANLIQAHEDNLRRIQALKQQIHKARVRVENMPPDKQEIYIGILRKEQASMNEMKSLLRRKKNIHRGLHDFLEGSIQVLDSLYPPVRVQIGNAIREIRQKLNTVTLKYDNALGIVSNSPTQHK